MPNDESVRVLSETECRAVLRQSTLGRLATAVGGTVDIVPVNFYSDGQSILLRTAPGTKLLELTINDQVALETDSHNETEAWSVVVHGSASQLELREEIDEAEHSPLVTWSPTAMDRWVRIVPQRITGRWLRRAAD